MATRPVPAAPTRGRTRNRGIGVVRVASGKKTLKSRVSKEEQKRRFKLLEEAKITEVQRVAIEKATLATSDKAVSSASGAPIHRGESETREGAQPLHSTQD